MAIALDSGGSGGRGGEARRVQPRRAASSREPVPARDFTPEDRAEIIVETGRRPVMIITFRQRWVTASDERTCPVCAPLHGQVFLDGEGPVPPLHRSCRCQRVNAGVEITSRGSEFRVPRVNSERGTRNCVRSTQ